MQSISIKNLVLRFKWKVGFTFLLVIIESMLDILYPLFIGLAIDGLLKDDYTGILYLAILGGASLLVGSCRRFYDTRIYSGIYCRITSEMVVSERDLGSSVSKISARSNLLTEFVEFLENSMPQIVGAIISIVGVLIIIAGLNTQVFLASLGLLAWMFAIYAISGKLNYRFNHHYNNQLEKQVEVISSRPLSCVTEHFNRLMKWNIKLSDLETVNFSLIWCGVIALFIFAPVSAVQSGILSVGIIFSILMYVFDYIEKISTFPIYVQQLIRLKEITTRLKNA